ncbi:MAG TPA: phosphatidate cytidylyltransferase [Polyangiaceae bacterium]|nr:phosphatidate cytidylyltransferase [Polyangiaceae bacterium]
MAQSNLAIRLLTAAIVAPLLLTTLFMGPVWGWYAIVFVASLVGASELFGMTHPGDRVAQGVGIVTTGAVSLAVYFGSRDPRILLTTVSAVVIVGALTPLWRLGQIETAALRILAGMAGPLYVGALVTTLALLRRDMNGAGPGYVLFTLMLSWLADTGGYFAGRYFGKTKLYEAVSPKKTREGFAGSILGAVTGALLAHFWYLPSLPLVDGLVLALVGGTLGQLGDLAESLLKRSTGIKDSGSIVPGHGGILDRIDALLVASPIVYLYTVWAQGAGSPPGS